MFKRIVAPRALALVAAGSAALSASPVAVGQEAPQALERIEITGSLIKRIEGETALPVQVLQRADIERTGATNVEELLQTITATTSQNGTATAAGSGATTGGIATVSLRGLGSVRTLLLINGRRIAAYGNQADAVSVDLNTIPLAAIQRIEVLKEGASAIYGSEAIGGVINFILRSQYQGGEVSVDHGETTEHGGNPTHASLLYGYGDLAKDRFNINALVTYEHQDFLFGRQRGFANTAIFAQNDTTSGNTFPGNITAASPGFGAAPNFGASRNPNVPNCAPSVLDPNFPSNRCRFDPASYVALLPETERKGVFFNTHWELGSNLEAFTEFSYSYNTTSFTIQPVPVSDQFALPANNPLLHNPANPTSYPYIMPASNPLFVITGSSPADTIVVNPGSTYYPTAYVRSLVGAGNPLPQLLVRYRSFATGLRELQDITEPIRAVAGIKGSNFDWDWEASLLLSRNRLGEKVQNGYPYLSKLLPIYNDQNFNFWGPNTAATDAAVQATQFTDYAYQTKSDLSGATLKATHDWYQLPGGSVSTAIGTDLRHEKYEFDANPAIQTGDISGYGGNFLNVNQSRNVYAAFAELDVPIYKWLETDVAVRYDHYENSGSRTDPKFSLRLQPVREVLFRGSYGEGFRAPSLQELYLPQTKGVGAPGNSDPIRCPVTGSSNDCQTQFTDQNGGNPKLQNETSKNLSFGVVLEPNKYVSLSVDWFNTKLYNTINSGLGDAFVLSHLGTFGGLIHRGPNNLVVNGVTVPNSGSIVFIDQTNLNTGGTVAQGIDFDVKGKAPLGQLIGLDWGTVSVDWNGTVWSRYDLQNPDGSWNGWVGVNNPLSVNGTGAVVPDYRDVTTVTWDYGPWQGVIIRTFQGNYIDAPGNVSGTTEIVGAYERYNLQGSYTGIKNMRVSLGINNMFNRPPPYSNAPGFFQTGYDPSYGDPLGRLVYGKLTYSFK